MKDANSRTKAEALNTDVAKKPFKEMTPKQKWVFVLQVAVCIVTFGFVFPNVIG